MDLSCYPNPFSKETTISFSLPRNTEKAEIKIYNIKGQFVRKLDIESKSGVAFVKWDGLDQYNKHVANGVYLYKLSEIGRASWRGRV